MGDALAIVVGDVSGTVACLASSLNDRMGYGQGSGLGVPGADGGNCRYLWRGRHIDIVLLKLDDRFVDSLIDVAVLDLGIACTSGIADGLIPDGRTTERVIQKGDKLPVQCRSNPRGNSRVKIERQSSIQAVGEWISVFTRVHAG